MLALAEEYQVTKCIKYCKWMLLQMKRKKLYILLANEELEISRINAAFFCFKILSTAVIYGYTDIEDEITTNLARIGSNVYTSTYKQCELHPGFPSAFSNSPSVLKIVILCHNGLAYFGFISIDLVNSPLAYKGFSILLKAIPKLL